MPAFEDKDHRLLWLKGQTVSNRTWLFTRRALRLVPGLAEVDSTSSDFDPIVLATLRCLFTSFTRVNSTNRSTEEAVVQSISFAESIYDHRWSVRAQNGNIGSGGFAALQMAIGAAYCAAGHLDLAEEWQLNGTGSAFYYGEGACYPKSLMRENDTYFEKDTEVPRSSITVWHDNKMPSLLENDWNALERRFLEHPKAWEFWSDWCRSFLVVSESRFEHGLIEEITRQLNEDDWLEGPNQVASRIREIQALFDLTQSIRQLDRVSTASVRDRPRHSIGGNNPPENMQIEPRVVRETTIIWAALDELKAETRKKSPQRQIVLKIVGTLSQALKSILTWVARKGDLSVDQLIKWGIPLGAAAVLANPKLVADVIDAAKAWASVLP